MKIITIGGATQDSIALYKNQKNVELETKEGKKLFLALEEGKKIDIQTLHQSTGGGATNTAVSFKRLGFETTIICKVGTDSQADLITQELQKESVNINYIIRNQKEPTGFSFIIPFEQTGDRVVLAARGANKILSKQDIPFDVLKQQDWIYISPLSGDAAHLLPIITDFAKQNKTPIAHNPSMSQLTKNINTLKNSLKNIDILLLNAQEAEALMSNIKGASHLPQKHFRVIFKELLAEGPSVVVITDGKHGAYAASEENIYYHPSIIKDKIENTLGAGDAFCSTFIAQIAQSDTIESSLLMSTINASSVISYPDTKTGLLKRKEIESRAEGDSMLQIFKL